MTIIFFGNSIYSRIGAAIIHHKLGLCAIVTNPDRIDSRGRTLQSPLKEFGEANKIPVHTTSKIDAELIEKIAAMHPDFLVVEDYGLILPAKLLAVPKYAPLNVHHSLLPKYRGPSPAPYTILSGDKNSGVSVIHMAGKVDAGDIYAQTPYTLKADETTSSLLTKLNELGGQLVVEVMQDIKAGKAQRKTQNESDVVMTYYMKKEDGYLDPANIPDKTTIDRMVRAYFPWPTVWTKAQVNGKDVRIKFLPEGKIQMEGKNPVSKKDFLNGYSDLKPLIDKIM